MFNKKIQIFICFLIIFCFFSLAEEKNIPERIILNLTPNPACEIAVTWRTNLWSEKPRVELMKATAGSSGSGDTDINKVYKNVQFFPAVTEKVKIKEDIYVFSHSLVLKNLDPETLYQYRVGNGKTWSEWEHFRTASLEEKPFKFIYLGDPQNDIKSYCSRAFRSAYSAAPDSKFILVTGDLVSRPWEDFSWGDLFYAAGWVTKRVPFVMVTGNHGYYHEARSADVDGYLHWLWRPHFTQPQNGPVGMGETAFYFVYQGVKFIVLNGNEKLAEQVKWLEELLKNNNSRWTILAIHQPVYSTGKDRDNPELRGMLLPVIDKYDVDLVLQGHDHTYGRTYKLKNGKIVCDNEKGTVFVVSVSGPKFYPINEKHKKLMAKLGTDLQLYQVISVEKNSIIYESWTVTGEIFDSFQLTK